MDQSTKDWAMVALLLFLLFDRTKGYSTIELVQPETYTDPETGEQVPFST